MPEITKVEDKREVCVFLIHKNRAEGNLQNGVKVRIQEVNPAGIIR